MPHVNRLGNIAHGIAGQGACLNNVQFDTGGSACWYNESTIVYQHIGDDGTYLALWDINTHAFTQAHTLGANFLFGSGSSHWAAWISGVGLFTSSNIGVSMPTAGLLGLGGRGDIAYRPDYNGAGLRIREYNANDFAVSTGPVIEADIVGPKQVIWAENGALKTFGLPPASVLSGSIFAPKAILLNDKWWIAYYSGTSAVLHPIDSLTGYRPVTGDAWFDIVVLAGLPSTIRFAWSTTEGEAAGTVHYVDINVEVDARINLGTGTAVPGVIPPVSSVNPSGGREFVITSSFAVSAASEELLPPPLEIWPSFPQESGYGRIMHPTIGVFDYEVKPDEWVNIDAEAIIPPVWSSTRTLTSAANVLWPGNLRDVVVEERWKALGGLAMPMTQLRMLMEIWTTPVDPEVGYVQWHPNYITGVAYKVIPIALTAGQGGLTFDDVANYLDEDGNEIGWMTNPVTLVLRLVERL